MTDLEITKRCAEKMGIAVVPAHESVRLEGGWMIANGHEVYEPLFDDAQAMALLKRYPLECAEEIYQHTIDNRGCSDLNRAICECVANLP